MLKYVLSSLIVSSVLGAYKPTYDKEFWEAFDAEEEPYEHDWLEIPDLIDMNTT